MFILLTLFILTSAQSEIVSEELKLTLNRALCDARCSKIPVNNCSCSNPDSNLTFSVPNEDLAQFKPALLCRDEMLLTFNWTYNKSLVYVVEVKADNWTVFPKSNNGVVIINKLKPDKEYEIRVWSASPEGYVYGPFASGPYKTFTKNYVPETVQSFDLVKWELVRDGYSLLLEWIPAEDRACFYDILLFPEKEYDISQFESSAIKGLFRENLTHFKFGHKYSIGIASKSLDSSQESPKVWLNVTAPTCLETFKNLIQCVPLPLEHVEVAEKVSVYYTPSDPYITYDVNVTWAKSEYTPDYYIVTLVLVEENSTGVEILQNITGAETRANFYNVTLSSVYLVRLTAWSPAGSSQPILIDKMLKQEIHILPSPPSGLTHTHISIIVGCSIGALAVIVITLGLCYRRYKITTAIHVDTSMIAKYYSESYDDKLGSSLYNATENYYIPDDVIDDDWKINSDDIVIMELLGEGAFGVVHKGTMKNKTGKEVEIAIKTLKGNSSLDEVSQFHQEIDIMKSVGIHPHLVSLIGCSSKTGHWGPLLIVEYCANGDLQTYLRDVWIIITSQNFEGNYVNSIVSQPTKVDNDFFNKSYELFGDKKIIEPTDLLSFSRQIAVGMEYLSALRVVHRDLAARNVLMCPNGTVKIADFGLSRDVYQDNIYTKTGTGRLPVKWMAIESLTHQRYTSQSDVWSFGIVLWEIVTLGGNPYSAINPPDLLSLLKKGYRLECPKNCGDELYHIMDLCWKENPKERPTFTQLLEKLNILLENDNNYVTLDLRY